MEDKHNMDEEKTMDESKKEYEKPELKVHGDLREITKSGGGNSWDVPIGTNINTDNVSPNDVTS
jgi:hypothetical protein